MSDPRYRVDQALPVGTEVILTIPSDGSVSSFFLERYGPDMVARVIPIGESTFNGHLPLAIRPLVRDGMYDNGQEDYVQWPEECIFPVDQLPPIHDREQLEKWLDQ